MITAHSVLETASRVDVEPELVGVQTQPSDGLVLTHHPRADRPERKRFRLRWQHASPAIAEAVSLHYEDHPAAFQFRIRSGAAFDAKYAEPPSFTPSSAAAIDIAVVLEHAFDSD